MINASNLAGPETAPRFYGIVTEYMCGDTRETISLKIDGKLGVGFYCKILEFPQLLSSEISTISSHTGTLDPSVERVLQCCGR